MGLNNPRQLARPQANLINEVTRYIQQARTIRFGFSSILKSAVSASIIILSYRYISDNNTTSSKPVTLLKASSRCGDYYIPPHHMNDCFNLPLSTPVYMLYHGTVFLLLLYGNIIQLFLLTTLIKRSANFVAITR